MSTLLILNRFHDEYSQYARYLSGSGYRTWLVTIPGESRWLRHEQYDDVTIVPNLERETVGALLSTHPERTASIQRIVCVSEFDQDCGAWVRELLGVPGPDPEYVRRFRDKAYSKRIVSSAGIPTPHWTPISSSTDAGCLVAEIGLPLIVKPVDGAASRGVRKCESLSEVATALSGLDPQAKWEAEEFFDGPVYHVDGYRTDSQLEIVGVSVYVGTCLGYANGQPLGSVTLLPGDPARHELELGAEATLNALGLRDGVFHLEAFLSEDKFVFLEIGHRPGGAEVLPVLHANAGVDLMEAAVRLEAGLAPRTRSGRCTGSFGWVIVPCSGGQDQRITRVEATGEIPWDRVPHLITSPPGKVADLGGGYAATEIVAHIRADDVESAKEAAIAVFRGITVHWISSSVPQAN